MSLNNHEEEEGNDPTSNKVVLVGDEGVGKTSMFLRFKTDRFIETTSSTRYQAEHFKEWSVNGTPVKMTLYDTAGMERYSSTIPPTYFRHAQAVIIVYSIESDESIGNVREWIENFSVHRIGEACNSLKVLLVGNKLDLEHMRRIQSSRVKETAEQCGIPEHMLFEVSTKEGTGFDELFDTLALSVSASPRQRRKTIRAGVDNNKQETNKKKLSCSRCT